ncbi:uncharacterized protein VTP21DRAFT_515 [Calcarisporiella thermophila]|uniref:uncharacterized protein n=1 Tax=Calcarisporiella thermophila TaxID=911321 RepID=UPI0037446ADE
MNENGPLSASLSNSHENQNSSNDLISSSTVDESILSSIPQQSSAALSHALPHDNRADSPNSNTQPSSEASPLASQDRASDETESINFPSSPTPNSQSTTEEETINSIAPPISIATKPPRNPARHSLPVQSGQNASSIIPSQSSSSSQQHSIQNSHVHRRHHHHKSRRTTDASIIPPSPKVGVAPPTGMYWSRAVTYGKISPPKALRAHTVNVIGELMYVFGGCDAKTCFNTLYILDLDTMSWSKPKTHGEPPPPCRAHSCTLVDKRLFLFGGGDGPVKYFNDLYILNTETLLWTKANTQGQPPTPRRAHSSCFYNNKLYIFGGGDGMRALNDVYTLDIKDSNYMAWSKLSPRGVPPTSRGYHTSNLVGDKWIIFGGSDGHECFSDVNILDLSTLTWIQVELDRPIPRLSHTATQVGSYLFIVGGHDGSRYSSDVLLLNLVTMSWETREVYGVAPSGRGYHATTLYDSRLFVFGGYDGHSVFDELYILELGACAYLPQITNFTVEC